MNTDNELQNLPPSTPTPASISDPSALPDELYGPAAQERYREWVKQFDVVAEAGLTEENIQRAVARYHADAHPVPSFTAYKRRRVAADLTVGHVTLAEAAAQFLELGAARSGLPGETDLERAARTAISNARPLVVPAERTEAALVWENELHRLLSSQGH